MEEMSSLLEFPAHVEFLMKTALNPSACREPKKEAGRVGHDIKQ